MHDPALATTSRPLPTVCEADLDILRYRVTDTRYFGHLKINLLKSLTLRQAYLEYMRYTIYTDMLNSSKMLCDAFKLN